MRNWMVAIILVALAVVPTSGFGVESERVLVLPVAVYSDGGGALTDAQATALLREQLVGAGITTVEDKRFAGSRLPASFSEASIREAGTAQGAQRVLWGSLSLVGTAFSVDLRMIDTRSSADSDHFFAQGDGLETLAIELNKITNRIGAIVFRQDTIARIDIRGHNRIEADAIERKIRTRPGDRLDRTRLSEDLKAVFAMGYFDDVRISTEGDAAGRVVVFAVTEKPTIRRIRFSGNKKIKDQELKESLTLRSGAILNAYTIQNNKRIIEEQYKAKSYHYVQVSYKTKPLKNNQADLEFEIEEGDRIRIENITIEGNTAFDDDDLTDLMETSESGLFSFITESGKLDREVLQSDSAKIAAFYQNNGFVKARAGEPQVTFTEDGIDVIIKVKEGPRYTIGTVGIVGDFGEKTDSLQKRVGLKTGDHFNRGQMRQDVMVLTEAVADDGYAFADIQPRMKRDEETRTIDVTYTIRKGRQVYFERILISGNTKTRDKVIRRELRVYEQGLYSGKKLKRSIRNLYRLNFFENDIKVDTPRGSGDDKMLLKINVTDKATGMFLIGGGYSTEEEFYAQASVSQENLFGRGQQIKLQANLGNRSTKYDLTLTEPWLFDLPLLGRVRGFNWKVNYESYDKDSLGGGFDFSYPVWDYTRLGFGYTFENTVLGDFTTSTPDSVRTLEGTTVTSSINVALRYDSRDRIINTTEGLDTQFSAEYAGVGGDIGFTKLVYDASVHVPLTWKMTTAFHGKIGWVSRTPGMILPDYSKFYLGGINSLRGFDWREIGVDEINSSGTEVTAGGEKLMQYNVELIFPLVPEAGVVGLLFYDTGNIWNEDEPYRIQDMRQSYGAGFRWFSPVGPIRLEYGWILNPEVGETQHGKWQFSMGTAF